MTSTNTYRKLSLMRRLEPMAHSNSSHLMSPLSTPSSEKEKCAQVKRATRLPDCTNHNRCKVHFHFLVFLRIPESRMFDSDVGVSQTKIHFRLAFRQPGPFAGWIGLGLYSNQSFETVLGWEAGKLLRNVAFGLIPLPFLFARLHHSQHRCIDQLYFPLNHRANQPIFPKRLLVNRKN
jgi:hypothetical protein